MKEFRDGIIQACEDKTVLESMKHELESMGINEILFDVRYHVGIVEFVTLLYCRIMRQSCIL